MLTYFQLDSKNKLEWNRFLNANIFIEGNAFEYVNKCQPYCLSFKELTPTKHPLDLKRQVGDFDKLLQFVTRGIRATLGLRRLYPLYKMKQNKLGHP